MEKITTHRTSLHTAEVIEPIPEKKIPEETMTQERFDSMLVKLSELQEENQQLKRATD